LLEQQNLLYKLNEVFLIVLEFADYVFDCLGSFDTYLSNLVLAQLKEDWNIVFIDGLA